MGIVFKSTVVKGLSLSVVIVVLGGIGWHGYNTYYKIYDNTPAFPKPKKITIKPIKKTFTKVIATFNSVEFNDLPNIKTDAMKGALIATQQSCSVFTKKKNEQPIGTKVIPLLAKDMKTACARLKNVETPTEYKVWLQDNFNIWSIADANGNAKGMFTGYFEAELEGSLNKQGEYQYPIYGWPNDMAIADLSEWDMNGEKIVGRIVGKKFVPYLKRGAIDAINLNAPVLAWGKDPVEIFLLHIQGSGRIKLSNGTVVRIGYAGNNGYKYKSLGKALIDAGHITYAKASWTGIKKWVKNNPDKADAMLATNERYIFFRKIKDSGGPIGNMGVGLTAKRSLAVDSKIIPMGLPLWLDADGVGDIPRLSRMMQAQDTGSAIRGAVRGDFFWGYGDTALAYAGKMKSIGKYYIFLPKGINPNKINAK